MGRYLAGFDASVLTAADAVVVVDEAARIEKMAATFKALAGARADTAGLGAEGDASFAHALARHSGTSVSKAADALRTARRLGAQPHLDAAVRAGALSVEEAVAISDAVAADPGAEARLVASAPRSSLVELRNECERTKAAADADAEARHRRIHAARYARRRSCADGSAEIVYRSTRSDISQAWAVVSGFANDAFGRARRAGHHEPAEAYAADGLLAMALAAAGGTPTVTGPTGGGGASTGGGGAPVCGWPAPTDEVGAPAGGGANATPGGARVPAGTADATAPTGSDAAPPDAGAGRGGGGPMPEGVDGVASPVLVSVGAAGALAGVEGAASGSEAGRATTGSAPAAPDTASSDRIVAGPAATGGVLPGLEPQRRPEPVAPAAGVARGRARSPVPTRILVRIDWTALVRGR
ncbi:MAG TPA: hypothetical protein VHM89_00380, partial [Acidimicrobiales bacterium]|nr:hypothetical protein [Acidimicrobiales bacterium]